MNVRVSRSPVNAEVQLALVSELGQELFFGLPDGHALGKHGIYQELTGLRDKRTPLHNLIHRNML